MKKAIVLLSLIALIFVVAVVIVAKPAHANPSSFLPMQSTSGDEASTTLRYISPGAATTTLVYDSYQLTSNTTQIVPRVVNQASLIYWLNATNTTSQLNINVEYSPGIAGVDCKASPTKCDWYQDRGNYVTNVATTSIAFNLGSVAQFSHKFASSTPGLLGAATNASTTGAILLRTPMRYMRAVFTVPVGAANVGIWAAFVPVKQNP